jgi:hypothetical protein
MLSMQNHPGSVPTPPSALDAGNHGLGPFRLNSLGLSVNSIAVESPSSSDDSQSLIASVTTDEDLPLFWSQEPATDPSRPSTSLATSKVAGRMRRQSEPATASSTRFGFTVIRASDSMDSDSPETVIPKIEEIDEEGDGSVLSRAVEEQNPTRTEIPVNVPRKRGRPRKHPLPSPEGHLKVAKGRSKTGCITCRRRKKKCDETKPACLNCQKNAVVCEGYPPKEIWKSGKQKMEDGMAFSPPFFWL